MPDRIKHAREWIPETDTMLSKRGVAPEMPIKSIGLLNDFLWGLHRQELTCIGARTSNGKSVLAIQIAWDMAKQGHSVYYMSLEMPVPRIIERIFSYECLVDNTKSVREWKVGAKRCFGTRTNPPLGSRRARMHGRLLIF